MSRPVAESSSIRPALPGTRTEVTAIQASFAKQFGSGVSIALTRDRATKSAVESDVGKCEYLHFSTHGFFAPPALKSAETAASAGRDAPDSMTARQSVSGYQPGLLSGLVFAAPTSDMSTAKRTAS